MPSLLSRYRQTDIDVSYQELHSKVARSRYTSMTHAS